MDEEANWDGDAHGEANIHAAAAWEGDGELAAAADEEVDWEYAYNPDAYVAKAGYHEAAGGEEEAKLATLGPQEAGISSGFVVHPSTITPDVTLVVA